jgi:translin
MSDLKLVLEKVKGELLGKDKVRDDAHEKMRKATSLSKRATLLVHQKRLKDAKEEVESAKKIITGLQGLAEEYPQIVYGGMFSAALQEYAEANLLIRLVEKHDFVSAEDLHVPSDDYVLGLADVVGELRRLVLDALREGNVKKAEKYLETMDEIYIELLALDEAYMLVSGLRHKNDVARRIIEATRGDVTQEVRRKSLEEHLKRLEKAQAEKPKPRKGKE